MIREQLTLLKAKPPPTSLTRPLASLIHRLVPTASRSAWEQGAITAAVSIPNNRTILPAVATASLRGKGHLHHPFTALRQHSHRMLEEADEDGMVHSSFHRQGQSGAPRMQCSLTHTATANIPSHIHTTIMGRLPVLRIIIIPIRHRLRHTHPQAQHLSILRAHIVVGTEADLGGSGVVHSVVAVGHRAVASRVHGTHPTPMDGPRIHPTPAIISLQRLMTSQRRKMC